MNTATPSKRPPRPRVGDTWEIRVPGKPKKVKVIGRIYRIECYVKPGVIGRTLYAEWQREPKGRYSGISFKGLWKYGRLIQSAADRKPLTEAKDKPLFIPLNSEYYEAFAEGRKTEELRLYGPRWNENTCRVGREVILSKGYGKHARMKGKVLRFSKLPASLLKYPEHRQAVQALYGTLDVEVAVISICDLKPL